MAAMKSSKKVCQGTGTGILTVQGLHSTVYLLMGRICVCAMIYTPKMPWM